MINNVVLVGRLTKDPELKVTTGSSVPFVNFTLAVNRNFSDQSGERQADFISCIAWRGSAENLARYMKQGSLIGLEGRIQTRTYESEQGTRYITEVVANSITFLESKRSGDGASGQSNDYQRPESKNDYQGPLIETDTVADDDLPF